MSGVSGVGSRRDPVLPDLDAVPNGTPALVNQQRQDPHIAAHAAVDWFADHQTSKQAEKRKSAYLESAAPTVPAQRVNARTGGLEYTTNRNQGVERTLEQVDAQFAKTKNELKVATGMMGPAGAAISSVTGAVTKAVRGGAVAIDAFQRGRDVANATGSVFKGVVAGGAQGAERMAGILVEEAVSTAASDTLTSLGVPKLAADMSTDWMIDGAKAASAAESDVLHAGVRDDIDEFVLLNCGLSVSYTTAMKEKFKIDLPPTLTTPAAQSKAEMLRFGVDAGRLYAQQALRHPGGAEAWLREHPEAADRRLNDAGFAHGFDEIVFLAKSNQRAELEQVVRDVRARNPIW